MAELGLEREEYDVLAAELEGVANGYIDDAGAVSVLRLHALSGRSFELAEDAGGRYTFGAFTAGLIEAMAAQAPFAQWLSTPVDSLGPVSDGIEVRTRKGDVLRARTCVLTVPLNVLPHIASRVCRRPSAMPSRSARPRAGSSCGCGSRARAAASTRCRRGIPSGT